MNASKCTLKYMVPTSLAKDKNPKCCMLGVISPSEPVYSGPHIRLHVGKRFLERKPYQNLLACSCIKLFSMPVMLLKQS